MPKTSESGRRYASQPWLPLLFEVNLAAKEDRMDGFMAETPHPPSSWQYYHVWVGKMLVDPYA